MNNLFGKDALFPFGEALACVGLFTICFVTLRILRSLWRGFYSCVLIDLFGLQVDLKKFGQWAVITGATDGIGKEYAIQLAAKGLDIVLISRTESKLVKVAAEIEDEYKVATKIVTADLAGEKVVYDVIKDALQNLKIAILVNNVGVCYKRSEKLTKVRGGEKLAEDILNVNILSVVRMTQIVLPSMEMTGKGVIVNVGSIGALHPVPGLSMYGASKCFVDYFTRATQEEYRKKGIIFQSFLPYYVSTNMFNVKPNFCVCTPETCVRWSLKAIGSENRTYGYPIHRLLGYAIELQREYLPEGLSLCIYSAISRKYVPMLCSAFNLKKPKSDILLPKD